MKIFDPSNPRHREILREELFRAKQIINEEESYDDRNDHVLAVKDPFGRMLYRASKSIMSRNPETEHKFNLLLSHFLRHINKVTMEDMSVNEMDKFHHMVKKLYHKLNPPIEFDPNNSALDADSYRAGQGRGGWQGD